MKALRKAEWRWTGGSGQRPMYTDGHDHCSDLLSEKGSVNSGYEPSAARLTLGLSGQASPVSHAACSP